MGSIEKRLGDKFYPTVKEFADDIRQLYEASNTYAGSRKAVALP